MMSMNSKQPHFAMHPTLPEHKYPSLHSSSEAIRRACLPTPPVSAPSPRTRPARPPLPVSETLHVGADVCPDPGAGIRGRGLLEESRYEAGFVPWRLMSGSRRLRLCVGRRRSEWGALGPGLSTSLHFLCRFHALKRRSLCVFGCVTRVPGCELHLHFFFFPPPFSSFTPVPGMCPHAPLSSASAPFSSHARPFSSDPLSRPQCVPTLSFPVSTIPTPVVIILVALCVAFGSLCFLACVVLFRVFAFFVLFC
uniref:Uncharacterized protein n=1 Tax=Capra hircus TaxID=9925 RepID=A0A8C2QTD6_CAPHI